MAERLVFVIFTVVMVCSLLIGFLAAIAAIPLFILFAVELSLMAGLLWLIIETHRFVVSLLDKV